MPTFVNALIKSSPGIREKLLRLSTAVVVGLSAVTMAGPFDRPVLGEKVPATCNCRSASDCTCPRGQCKCRNCGAHSKAASSSKNPAKASQKPKPVMIESLQGSTEKTKLPETARHDARGGIFL
jgi:hypothetical protein